MTDRGRPQRPYDAQQTKETILDAAEAAFADGGFSGARVDAIAAASGYNKSLIYQYFGDKLALYTEVVKRVDRKGHEAVEQTLRAVSGFPSNAAATPGGFEAFLIGAVEGIFDFLFEHPAYLKILFWEAAEEWKTWNAIQYEPDDVTDLNRLVEAARANGIIRADFDPALFPILIMSATAGAMRFSQRFGSFWGQGSGANEHYDFPETPDAARRRHLVDQIIKFIKHGIMEA